MKERVDGDKGIPQVIEDPLVSVQDPTPCRLCSGAPGWEGVSASVSDPSHTAVV